MADAKVAQEQRAQEAQALGGRAFRIRRMAVQITLDVYDSNGLYQEGGPAKEIFDIPESDFKHVESLIAYMIVRAPQIAPGFQHRPPAVEGPPDGV